MIFEIKNKAIKKTISCKEAAVYMDSFIQNGLVGIEAY